jgi:S-(hydroxymethyl)mycothiol dehydrogenase
MTGFGAIVNTAKVGHGDTVAVFGCGGVGDAAIHAAALAGARKVIAVDLDRRKLAWAAELGATDLVDPARSTPSTRSGSSPAGSAPT